MTASSKRVGQQVIAIIVIVAILEVIEIPLAFMVLLLVGGVLVWRVIQRSVRRETREVFDFYVSTDEILRSEEHHWYGFEIAEVISRGENVLAAIPDPPPLLCFALGALHHRVGDHDSAVELLAPLVEHGMTEEGHRSLPSPQLRRYVEMLRQIERDPAVAPLALAAVRRLERLRRTRAKTLLGESRAHLQTNPAITEDGDVSRAVINPSSNGESATPPPVTRTLNSITPPRSISEVLHDVYDDGR